MVNTFLNTDWVSMEILRQVLNDLVVTEYFNKSWEKDFNKEFAPGSSVTVKFPWRPQVVDGMGYTPKGITRTSTTISLDQWVQMPFEWDDYEAAVKLERSQEELKENYFAPCAAAIAQEIDSRNALFATQNASNIVGTLGTSPTSVKTYYQARQILKEEACPPGKRAMLISSEMMEELGSNITNIFHPADELDAMFKEGALGKLAGFSFFESNSLYSVTAGTWAGTVSVTGANQSGTTISITGTNAGDTIKAGNKIAIADVNRVNPMTRRVAGKKALRSFTVTTDVTITGSAQNISILPAIYGPGSDYQNVDALPADSAAVTLFPGTTTPSGKVGTLALGLTRYAFALVGAKLYVPKAVEEGGQAQDPESGLQIRKVKAWDPARSMQINRMDTLFGRGNLYQSNGSVVVAGA